MPLQRELNQKQLDDLYQWVDSLQLSRPKRNITRDFSDGVLMAETVNQFFPKLIELHNYPAANSIKSKKQNWQMLNNKAFTKLGFYLSQIEIQKIVESVPMVVQYVLFEVKQKIRAMEEENNNKVKKRDDQMLNSPKRQFNMRQKSKVQQLQQILSLLKQKITSLQRSNARKQLQIKQLQEMIQSQSIKVD